MQAAPTNTISHAVSADFHALLQGRLHDPFRYLGVHRDADGWVLRVFQPYAEAVWLRLPAGLQPLDQVHPAGLFEWRGKLAPPAPYALGVSEGGHVHELHDPYAFAPALSGHDLYLFNEGHLHQAWRTLGTHLEERNGVRGVRFAVWAPNAERVSVVGEFNRWDGRVHPMAVLFLSQDNREPMARYLAAIGAAEDRVDQLGSLFTRASSTQHPSTTHGPD